MEARRFVAISLHYCRLCGIWQVGLPNHHRLEMKPNNGTFLVYAASANRASCAGAADLCNLKLDADQVRHSNAGETLALDKSARRT